MSDTSQSKAHLGSDLISTLTKLTHKTMLEYTVYCVNKFVKYNRVSSKYYHLNHYGLFKRDSLVSEIPLRTFYDFFDSLGIRIFITQKSTNRWHYTIEQDLVKDPLEHPAYHLSSRKLKASNRRIAESEAFISAALFYEIYLQSLNKVNYTG